MPVLLVCAGLGILILLLLFLGLLNVIFVGLGIILLLLVLSSARLARLVTTAPPLVLPFQLAVACAQRATDALRGQQTPLNFCALREAIQGQAHLTAQVVVLD